MEGLVIVVWIVVGGTIILSLFLHLRDSIQLKKRSVLIKQIANSLNWNFSPRYHLPGFDVSVNVLQGNIGQAKVYIFDTPIQTYIKPHDTIPLRGSVITTLPGTKMLMLYENGIFPLLKLQPSEIGDSLFSHSINSKNFIVIGDDLDMLTAVFTPEVITHYEKTPDLYIRIKNETILLHFNADKYLPSTKEKYLDLIAEGKYIHQLVQIYLP